MVWEVIFHILLKNLTVAVYFGNALGKAGICTKLLDSTL